uniref:Protein SCO1/2 n=1 Tax=Candidatus Kentrum sp. LPFa TaxID=2126335 RepID=A0A450X0V0_9GAMM|nr:MAG: protein SCO1/2 [Candidatus Kentron sp. LPFa]VFK22905.1 MAG: protein SCO1/2 [Candidatus Kentron sp. LPFa]
MNEQKQDEHPISNLRLILIGFALLAIICMLLWFGVSQREKSINPDAVTTILGKPREVPAFSLTDHHGNPFTQANLRGQWTFLYFGYTACPDVCPTTLGALTQADRILRKEPAPMHPKFVFISVDSERDEPEQLARYVPYFNPDFLGVTGVEEEISNLTRPLGVVYRRVYGDDAKSYLIDHSASVSLIDPEGRMVALMSPPHDAAAIARNFRDISNRFEQAPAKWKD